MVYAVRKHLSHTRAGIVIFFAASGLFLEEQFGQNEFKQFLQTLWSKVRRIQIKCSD